MIPKNREPTAPGVYLKRILEEEGITHEQLHKKTGIGIQTISMIVNGKRNITPDTAVRLAHTFDMSPEFWMNMQTNLDLFRAEREYQAAQS